MLIAYFWTENEIEEELMQWSDLAPSVGELIPGTNQPILKVEMYQGESETVCLAISNPTYGEGEHTFHVQLNEQKNVITYGMSMIGKPPVGRLMNYETTGHPTLMRPVPSRWVVDLIETCQPVAGGSYKAVYLCYCVEAPLSIAA